MSDPRVRTGVVVLAVLGVLDLVSPLIFAVPDAPAAADAVSVVLGLVTLVALGFWARRPGRGPLWVTVVGRVLSALPGLLGLAEDGMPMGLKVAIAVFTVVTVIAVVLVRPGLGRAMTPART